MKSAKNDYEIILHIGMQRTGSTFLQEELFSNISEINRIEKNKKIYMLIKNIEKHNEKNLNDMIKKEFDEYFSQNKINLISDENISCRMWTKEDNRYKRIYKIKHFFPNAKIIFGIRNKTNLLISWYKKYVICGGVLSFQYFKKNIININKINYDPYIEHLYELFGKKNVFVYKFENMKEDIHKLVNNICSFIGVKTPNFNNVYRNIGYSFWQLKISLLINRFFKTSFNPEGIFPLGYELHPHRKIFQSAFFPLKLRGNKVTIENLRKI